LDLGGEYEKTMFIGNFSGNGSIFNQSIVFDRTNNCDNCSVLDRYVITRTVK